MTEQFYDPEQAKDELKTKLKLIRSALKPLIVDGKVPSSNVPSDLREEIVKIYDEHGGINLLTQILKLGYNTIKNWHKTWQSDPLVFRKPIKRQREKGSQVEKVVKKVLGANKSETIIKKEIKAKHIITENSTPVERLSNDLTLNEEAQIKKIKEMMAEKLRSGKGLYDNDDLKNEVVKLYRSVGEANSVAILLGLSEKAVKNLVEN